MVVERLVKLQTLFDPLELRRWPDLNKRRRLLQEFEFQDTVTSSSDGVVIKFLRRCRQGFRSRAHSL
jgi:hypothetical protein